MIKALANWRWGEGEALGPGQFSWFHILWLVICIAFCIFLVKKAKKITDRKKDDKVILTMAILLTISELGKQLMYHIGYYGYLRIDILPFAFCSVPIYMAYIGSLVKNEKIKEACYKFLAFFGIVGGLAVMLYAKSVLETYFVFMSIHSMLWHTILVGMAVYLITARGYGQNFKKDLFQPFIVFLVLTFFAACLNEGFYHGFLKDAQVPSYTVDVFPGSYTYYRMGTMDEDGKVLTVKYDGESLSMGDVDSEAIKTFVLYFKSDEETDLMTLSFLDENDVEQFVGIDSDEKITISEENQNYFTMEWLSEEAVLTTDVNGEKMYLTVAENGDITPVLYSEYGISENAKLEFLSATQEREGDSANFFFISAHYETLIPGLHLFQKVLPYPLFLVSYCISFGGVSCLIWCIVKGIRVLKNKKEKN